MAEKSQNSHPQCSSSIKSHWLRRQLTRASVALLKNRRPRSGSVLFLTPNICVKYGSSHHVAEAFAMQYIASHTSIPVPKIHCAFQRKGITYIVMSRLPGTTIAEAWHTRTEGSKAHLLEQLKRYVDEMRNLDQTQPGIVEGLGGRRLFDPKLPEGCQGFGPFASIRDFHRYLRRGLSESPADSQELEDLVDWQDNEASQYNTCFTHGDLCSTNILVDGNKISGIVDWESSGWLPEYWEFTSAWNVNMYNVFWRFELEKFLHPYTEEVEMEHIRLKHFSD
ncbi:MAG: hypothetical protein M1821_000880 [Bathelium mastoideum]|nr:MAG: hypothetical protein M1821_000880 [Bathelium mastoideum]